MSSATVKGMGATLSVALLALFASTSLASAGSDPIGSGTTTITLSKAFTKTLKQHKVRLVPIAPAQVSHSTLTLPVSGGTLDSATGVGTVDHGGQVKFTLAKRVVLFKDFVLNTTTKTPLIAKVDGGQLNVAAAPAFTSSREGFGAAVSVKTLKLTEKTAVRLNKKLGLKKVFKVNQLIGSSLTKTQPSTVQIQPAGKLTLDPDPQAFAKLAEHHVSINPVSPAELSSGSFGFSIIPGGTIAPNASLGTLKSGGSIELLRLEEKTSSYGQVVLHEIWLNLAERTAMAELEVQPTPPYRGKKGQTTVLDLNMSSATVSADPTAHTVAVSGATASFNPTLAASFNEALANKEEVFKAGEALGTLSFTVGAE
jgi:hypothetical protein